MASMETYHGQVRTPADAVILFEACRLGILPRVQRRLSEKERQQIRSGSVFVWDEREAGMRRWTDGKSWSASRVSGSFLTYREMEGKRGGFSSSSSSQQQKRAPAGSTPTGRESRDSDQDGAEEGPDGYRYKPDGLMKQSFSITTQDGRHLHLISYFARQGNAANLPLPSQDPNLRNIRPQKGMYPEATLADPNAIPPVTRGPMGGPGGAWAGPPPPPGGHQQQMFPYPPPPQGYYVTAHHYPAPPQGHWPPTPSGTPGPPPYGYYPPHHPAYQYPPPPHGHYPPPGHYPPGSYPAPPSLPTPTTLPPLQNGLHSPSQGPPSQSHTPNPPAHSGPPPPPQPSTHAHSYPPPPPPSNGVPARESEPHTPQTNGFKYPSPPPASAGAPPPLPEAEKRNGGAGTTIPSIGLLLGGSQNGNGAEKGNGHRTPPMNREMAHPVVVAGNERDRSDLKRLDKESLKFS
jgi:hypothetical protein